MAKRQSQEAINEAAGYAAEHNGRVRVRYNGTFGPLIQSKSVVWVDGKPSIKINGSHRLITGFTQAAQGGAYRDGVRIYVFEVAGPRVPGANKER